jgi:hypothetical protein
MRLRLVPMPAVIGGRVVAYQPRIETTNFKGFFARLMDCAGSAWDFVPAEL